MAQPAGAVYEFGDFRVLVRTRTLLKDGEVVGLPPKAFDTLVVLLARAGEDVSKSELIDAVWPGVFVEENNLTQAISTVRKVLGERPNDHRFIVTRPGRGYRFVAAAKAGAPARLASSPHRARWGLPVSLIGAAFVVATMIGPVMRSTAPASPPLRPAAAPSRYSGDAAAYEPYLRGRFFWNKRTKADYEKALGFFEEAIRANASFAPAFAGVADCDVLRGLDELDASARMTLLRRAKDAALHAVALDDTLGEAHASLGAVREVLDKDSTAAEREYRRAIALDPQYATAYQWLGELLEADGRFAEATTMFEQARRIEPLSLVINVALGEHFYYLRRNDEAIAQFQRTVELDPAFLRARFDLALALEQKRAFDAAIAEFQRIRDADAANPKAIAALAHAYAAAGQPEQTRRLFKEFERRARGGAEPYDELILSLGLGDTERAIAWLAKARQRHDGNLLWLLADPRLDSLRADGRWRALFEG